jgi:hypothetical protein
MKTMGTIAVSLFAVLATNTRAQGALFKGRTSLKITGFENGVFSFGVKGRVTPLGMVTGSGTYTVNEQTGDFGGTMTLTDPSGHQLNLMFKAIVDGGSYSGNFTITGGTGNWTGSGGGGGIVGNIGDVTLSMIFDGFVEE